MAAAPRQQCFPVTRAVGHVFSADGRAVPGPCRLGAACACEQCRLLWWTPVDGTCTLVDPVLAAKTGEWGAPKGREGRSSHSPGLSDSGHPNPNREGGGSQTRRPLG